MDDNLHYHASMVTSYDMVVWLLHGVYAEIARNRKLRRFIDKDPGLFNTSLRWAFRATSYVLGAERVQRNKI